MQCFLRQILVATNFFHEEALALEHERKRVRIGDVGTPVPVSVVRLLSKAMTIVSTKTAKSLEYPGYILY